MQVIHERCCGLDVHKKTVVACVLCMQGRRADKHLETFSTTLAGLLALSDWLSTWQVTHVAMESTGVYWRPVFNVLESCFQVILVNAQHIKAVPGRKTDVKDSEWIADLLRHGLLHASFIPPKPTRDLRDLLRYRKQLQYERTREVNRLQAVLETANIKLSTVARDVMGKSGQHMIKALIEGTTDGTVLAELARGSLRGKIPQLQEALQGRVDEHHRLLLSCLLLHLECLEHLMERLLQQIEAQYLPDEQAITLLCSIPGIQRTAAVTILGEIGTDMSCFPSAKHLASWAGVCPSNRESAGKRLKGEKCQGNGFLKAVLAEVVWAISHTKGNFLAAHYHRLARRLGKPKAVVAVMHRVLVVIYHVLADQKPYEELGEHYHEQHDQERLMKQALRRLEACGYTVTLTPREEVAT